MRSFVPVLFTILSAVAPVTASSAEMAVLHFADMHGIRSWRALQDGNLLIEGRNDKFFVATFFGPCPELRWASAVGFVTDATGDLTKFDSILVRGERCHFRSLEQIAPEIAKALK